MNKKVFVLLSVLFCCAFVNAQETVKSELQQKAEAIDPNKNIAGARSLYIHAFNDYYNKGRIQQGVECAVKATALYYKENFYKEAFDLLRRADDAVNAGKNMSPGERAAAHYLVTKERLQMYIKLRKYESAKDQLRRECEERSALYEGYLLLYLWSERTGKCRVPGDGTEVDCPEGV